MVNALSLNRGLLESWEACPRQFFRLLDRFEETGSFYGGTESVQAKRGQIEHEICYEYALHLAATKQLTDLTRLDEIVAEALGRAHGIPEDVREEVERDIRKFADSYIVRTEGMVTLEQSMRLSVSNANLYNEKELKERGLEPDAMAAEIYVKPDITRVIGTAGFITDYKSWWKAYTENEAQKAYQLRLYALVLAETYNLETVECTYFFTKSGIERTFVLSRAEGDFDEVKRRTKNILRAIFAHEGEATPCPNGRCVWCDFLSDCPEAADVKVPKTAEEAKALAGTVLQLEAKHKQAADLLKEYVKTFGPVDCNGEVFQYAAKQGITFAPADVYAVLKDEAFNYLSFNGTKAKTKAFKEKVLPLLKGKELPTAKQRYQHGIEKGGEDE